MPSPYVQEVKNGKYNVFIYLFWIALLSSLC